MYIVKLYLFIMFCVDLLSMRVEHEEVVKFTISISLNSISNLFLVCNIVDLLWPFVYDENENATVV